MMPAHPSVKHWLDGAAVTTGALAFFDKIPWPGIAGFLSCVWLAIQIGGWLRGKFKEH